MASIAASTRLVWPQPIPTVCVPLTKIMALRGVNYDWKKESFPDRKFADGTQLGFIAQEVMNVLPELVTKGTDGYYSVNYSAAVPVLVEAMKEQQTMIDAQKAMIDSLRSNEAESKKKIAALETSLQNAQSSSTEMEKLKAEIETIKKALGIDVKTAKKD